MSRWFPRLSRTGLPSGVIVAGFVLALGAGAALAQDSLRPPPPGNVQKLSALIGKIETRPGFQYVDEIEWQNGAYVVTYFTTDRAKVEIKLDPISGEPK